MTAKKKYRFIKYLGIILNLLVKFIITTIGALFHWNELWKPFMENGEKISSFNQWITLIIYRLVIYLVPALILSIFKFDKRYNWTSRACIWLNWIFCLDLMVKASITVFAIDKIWDINIFNTLDSIILLVGYVFTFIKRKPISFDSTGSIIDKKAYED